MPFLKSLSKDLIITSPTTLEWQAKNYKCQTGKGGFRQQKTEGDGTTPTGTFSLRKIMFRADRVRPFKTSLPMEIIIQNSGWCDDPADPFYNRQVKLPYKGHHEPLWREDDIYDMLIVVGYNDSPAIAPKGSAIFIHLANKLEIPTAGCIALQRKDFIKIIEEITPESLLVIPEELTVVNKPSPPRARKKMLT